jgi:hypothetical protein
MRARPRSVAGSWLELLAIFAAAAAAASTSAHGRREGHHLARGRRRRGAPEATTDDLPDESQFVYSRVYTTPHNGRAYMASVIGLVEDEGSLALGPYYARRLPSFWGAWSRAWPGLHIQHQPSFLNHPGLLGYGCAVGHYMALTDTLRYLRARNATCDYHLVFEDDGLPFNQTTWPPFGAGNDLEAKLDALAAVGGSVLALGGHLFQNYSKADAAAAGSKPHGGVVHVEHIDGSFAYVYACTAMASVAARLHTHLREVTGKSAFERVLWAAFGDAHRSAGPALYASAPLLVDHAHGVSATWNASRNRPLEGIASFWNA